MTRWVVGLATFAVLIAALTIRSGIVFGVIALAVVFVPLERAFPLHQQAVRRPGWRTDVVHFVVNNLLTNLGLVIPVVAVGLALRALASPLHPAIAHQPAAMQFVEAFLLAELGGYFGHRAAHRIPTLWRFHKVHHSITEMDWLASAHLHPVDQVWIRSCFVVPLFALGFSRATFGGFLVFTTIQAIFIHANVRFQFGPLRWLIATPEFHHWHHALDGAARDSNFAGEFPWIDLLFGTLFLPDHQIPSGYGINEPQPAGYLAQLAWPFQPPKGADAAPWENRSELA